MVNQRDSLHSASSARPQRQWIQKMKEMKGPMFVPMHTPPYIIATMVMITALLIPLGAMVLISNEMVNDVSIRYDSTSPVCTYAHRLSLATDPDDPKTIPGYCNTTVEFTLEDTLDAPIFLYYELSDYNENFRDLVRSRSDSQLQASDRLCTCEDRTACPPYEHPGQRGDGDEDSFEVTFNDGTSPMTLGEIDYAPCGQLAWTMFNDSFFLRRENTVVCNSSDFGPDGGSLGFTAGNSCVKEDIAWPGDRKKRFQAAEEGRDVMTATGRPDVAAVNDPDGAAVPLGQEFFANAFYWREWGHRLPDQADLDFMVWAKPASVPRFKKLHRRITTDLPAGAYTLEVQERYDVSRFGEKRIVLATRSWLGADNVVLGAAFIFSGSLSFVFTVVLAVLHQLNPRGGYTTMALSSLDKGETLDSGKR
ncbi:ALA-interacting subunit 1 [Diplonema papillatum]|nr:ALA-interacting subunit 1 [Diplonema papillatum]